jgi:hypothetical protein
MTAVARAVALSLLTGLLAGFLWAASRTEITLPCPPGDIPADERGAHCLEMPKAITYPSDLWSNLQGSRTEFTTYFLKGFVVVSTVLLLVRAARAARAARRTRAARDGVPS